MKTIVKIKLSPSKEQYQILLKTLEAFNAACNHIAETAFSEKTANKYMLQKLLYHNIKKRFGISAQLVIRAISKVSEAYKRDKKIRPSFRSDGAVIYDPRIMSFRGIEAVSLSTVEGRQVIPMLIRDYFLPRMDQVKGQADLVLVDGVFYLLATCDLPEETPINPGGYLGVDMGIVNICTLSSGENFKGDQVEQVRQRYNTLRASLQKKGTKSAKHHLKKVNKKESRFKRDLNHRISKKIVEIAKGTLLGIALENLKGIHKRAKTVRRSQRSKHSGWSFAQLGSFIAYKAKLVGVPVVVIDPRNTSRECSECGHTEKANRKSQAEFVCKSCGYIGNADFNAAKVIASRAASTSLMSSVKLKFA
jgi:IS605 OrfB family transposase